MAANSIAAEVAEMQASRPAPPDGAPPSAFEVDRARMVAEFDTEKVLSVGSVLADVDLLDMEGARTSLFSVLAGRTTVLVFYRGEWCPYCSIALRAYQRDLVPRLGDLDAQLVAVSPQHPDGSLAAREKNELTFRVLSDPGNRLARQLGIVVTPSDASRELQRSRGLDLSERNGDGTPDLPMPTVAVVDADRVLRFIDVHPDYTTRTEASEVLAALAVL